MKEKASRRRRGRARRIAAVICLLLADLLVVLCDWYIRNYDTSLAGLLFTLTIPQKGTGASAVLDPLRNIGPTVLRHTGIFIVLLVLAAWDGPWDALRRKTGKSRDGLRRARRTAEKVLVGLGIAAIVAAPVSCFFRLHVPEYIRRVRAQTKLYEQEYIAPDEAGLKAPQEQPNVICLYLESMETTYASAEDGGIQEINYMPELTRLARENISFSNTDRLGGFHSTENTNWTMAAMFAGTSGLPFAFPVGQNEMSKYTTFAPDLVTLGDLLHREGYTQEFLCGSDGEYGGRALYFREHGGYEIYDLWKAREAGDIPKDYYVWWGFEDRILFRIAREELTRLWEAGKPFNLTILTVDAHHLGGYLCEECGDRYPDKTANVIACTDRQVSAFVNWCREQPFWDSTVMVINGDHPRMDTCLTGDVAFGDRTVYNCILNARKTPAGATTFRQATMMDLFPTTLSAMGWEIGTHRLGIGTDLFSGEKTLAERMGYERLNDELMKYSRYFVDHFAR